MQFISQIAELEDEITVLRDQNADGQNTLAELQNTLAGLQTRIEEITATGSTDAKPASESSSKGQQRATDIEALNAENRALEADNEELRNRVRNTPEEQTQEIHELLLRLETLEGEKAKYSHRAAVAKDFIRELRKDKEALISSNEEAIKWGTDLLAEMLETKKLLKLRTNFCHNFIINGHAFVADLPETPKIFDEITVEQMPQIASDDEIAALEQQLSILRARVAEEN